MGFGGYDYKREEEKRVEKRERRGSIEEGEAREYRRGRRRGSVNEGRKESEEEKEEGGEESGEKTEENREEKGYVGRKEAIIMPHYTG